MTAASITISVSGPFSGAYGPLFNGIYQNSVQVWQDDVNAHGGIYGRKLKLVKVDNQFTAEGAVSACKQTTSNHSFLVINMGGLTQEDDCENNAGMAVADDAPTYINRHWTRVVTAHIYSSLAPAEISFLWSPYVKAQAKKIGIVYDTDVPQFVAEYQALAATLRGQGKSFVHAEGVNSNDQSFVSAMSHMKASGAQVVLLVVGLDATGIVRDSKAISYTPQWIATPNSGAATDVVAQASGGLFDGMLGTHWYATTETQAFHDYVAKVEKYEGSAAAKSAGTIDIGIYSLATTIGKMLEMTGPNLGRDSFMAAAKEIRGFYNGLTVPFTLAGYAQLVGQHALWPAACCKSDGTWKLTGPYAEKFRS